MDGSKVDSSDLLQAFQQVASDNGTGKVSIAVDVEKYQSYLDDLALSDEQQEEVIRALWSLMVTFVELGFGVHPVQQACGKLEKELDPSGQTDSDRGNAKNAGSDCDAGKRPER